MAPDLEQALRKLVEAKKPATAVEIEVDDPALRRQLGLLAPEPLRAKKFVAAKPKAAGKPPPGATAVAAKDVQAGAPPPSAAACAAAAEEAAAAAAGASEETDVDFKDPEEEDVVGREEPEGAPPRQRPRATASA